MDCFSVPFKLYTRAYNLHNNQKTSKEYSLEYLEKMKEQKKNKDIDDETANNRLLESLILIIITKLGIGGKVTIANITTLLENHYNQKPSAKSRKLLLEQVAPFIKKDFCRILDEIVGKIPQNREEPVVLLPISVES